MKQFTYRAIAVVVLTLVTSRGAAASADAAETIVLDGQKTGLTFEGIGVLSAGASSRLLIEYPEPQRSEILDFLFKPKFGASIQHLKVEIGGDVNSTCGTEPSIARTQEEFKNPGPEYFNRGYEWWLMKEAKKRNPQIIFDALQWGAPGWVGKWTRKCITKSCWGWTQDFYSQDNADLIVAFIKGAKQYHDIDITYCGCWNEKAYDVEWIKLLRKTLNDAGLEEVKIVAADEINRWTIADKMAEDAELRDAVQVIGTHYPRFESTATAQGLGKPLWASEDGPWSGLWGASTYACRGLSQVYNRNYAVGKMTKTIIWNPISAYYDILPFPGSGLIKANEPWSGHYVVQPGIWITAHTTQFIEPGWKYLAGDACALLPSGGSHVAAVSADGRSLSVVIETMGAVEPQNLSFRLAGGLSADVMRAWRSTAAEQFVRIDDVAVRDGLFAIEVDPGALYSLTTTDGQQKGATSVSAFAPMPLPYEDDFEEYAAGATPRRFSDYYGAFETAETQGGGRCLKQVITRPGITWHGDGDPVTIIGSQTWSNYTVSCVIRLGFKQYAAIHGRISAVPRKGQPVHGYGLRVGGDGAWQLVLTQSGAELLSGKTTAQRGDWQRFGLRMNGDKLTVLIDGKEAGAVVDSTYKAGLAGLGSGYEAVCFDEFRIETETERGK